MREKSPRCTTPDGRHRYGPPARPRGHGAAGSEIERTCSVCGITRAYFRSNNRVYSDQLRFYRKKTGSDGEAP